MFEPLPVPELVMPPPAADPYSCSTEHCLHQHHSKPVVINSIANGHVQAVNAGYTTDAGQSLNVTNSATYGHVQAVNARYTADAGQSLNALQMIAGAVTCAATRQLTSCDAHQAQQDVAFQKAVCKVCVQVLQCVLQHDCTQW